MAQGHRGGGRGLMQSLLHAGTRACKYTRSHVSFDAEILIRLKRMTVTYILILLWQGLCVYKSFKTYFFLVTCLSSCPGCYLHPIPATKSHITTPGRSCSRPYDGATEGPDRPALARREYEDFPKTRRNTITVLT